LHADPFELVRLELDEQKIQQITKDVTHWRKNSIFRTNQKQAGKKILYNYWLCRWNNRVSSAKNLSKAK